jgi:hypothetical protein
VTPPASSPTSRISAASGAESEDGYRVFLTDGTGPEVLFKTAKDAGVQVRYLRPGAESLEDVFLRALGHEVQA